MTDKGYYFSSVIQIKGAAGLVDRSVRDPAGFGGTAPDARTVVVQLLTPSPDVLQIMGGFAGPETFLSYMRPSAEPG